MKHPKKKRAETRRPSDTVRIDTAELAHLLAAQGAEEHPTIPAPPPAFENEVA
jgi:hypothetical protein